MSTADICIHGIHKPSHSPHTIPLSPQSELAYQFSLVSAMSATVAKLNGTPSDQLVGATLCESNTLKSI